MWFYQRLRVFYQCSELTKLWLSTTSDITEFALFCCCVVYLFWHLIHLHATRICCFIMPHYEGRREGPCPFNKIAQFIIRRENSCYALNTNDIVFRMCKTLQSQIKAQWKPVPQLIHCLLLKLVGLVALYVATMRLRSIALLKPAVPIATMPWRSHLSVNR